MDEKQKKKLKGLVQRHYTQQLELSKRKDELNQLEKPEEPKQPIDIEDVDKPNKETIDYDNTKLFLETTIAEIQEKIENIESEIKKLLPDTDTEYKITNEHYAEVFKFLVRHESKTDQIKVNRTNSKD